jgi:hypothetical protein
MKRFMMLVGVAVVAAAMYVAASPASQRSSGPSAKDFKALKKQVASLTKTEKTLKKEADYAAGFVATCLTSNNALVVPVNEFGNTTGTGTTGYMYGTTSGATAVKAALDVDPSQQPGALLLSVDPSCVKAALSHGAGSSGLLHRAVRVP